MEFGITLTSSQSSNTQLALGEDTITLSFEEIEARWSTRLPPSSRREEGWWFEEEERFARNLANYIGANTYRRLRSALVWERHPDVASNEDWSCRYDTESIGPYKELSAVFQQRPWLQAGWRTMTLDTAGGQVIFSRSSAQLANLLYSPKSCARLRRPERPCGKFFILHVPVCRLSTEDWRHLLCSPELISCRRTFPVSRSKMKAKYGSAEEPLLQPIGTVWSWYVYFKLLSNEETFRIELRINHADRQSNTQIFDRLEQEYQVIEEEIGSKLEWSVVPLRKRQLLATQSLDYMRAKAPLSRPPRRVKDLSYRGRVISRSSRKARLLISY